jgi:hypothetical protein
VTVSGNYPTESVFAFHKPSVGRSVGNNPFRFHPYRGFLTYLTLAGPAFLFFLLPHELHVYDVHCLSMLQSNLGLLVKKDDIPTVSPTCINCCESVLSHS